MTIRKTFFLLLALAPLTVASSESLDFATIISEFLDPIQVDSSQQQQKDRGLFGHFGLFSNNNDNNDTTADNDRLPAMGDRCGLLSGSRGTCQEGLECAPLSAMAGSGRRCMPRRDCLGDSLQTFLGRPEFEGNAYKNSILRAANVDEMDVWEARRTTLNDDKAFLESEPIQAVRRSMDSYVANFTDLGVMMQQCAEPPQEGQQSASVSTVDPRQSNGTSPQIFIGLHLEGGTILDASFSALWQLEMGNVDLDERVLLRPCGGIEIGTSIELSFIVIVGFTTDASSLDCLSVLIDVDAAPFLAFGAGVGFCVQNSNTIYVEATIGAGVGAGVGVSLCEAIAV